MRGIWRRVPLLSLLSLIAPACDRPTPKPVEKPVAVAPPEKAAEEKAAEPRATVVEKSTVAASNPDTVPVPDSIVVRHVPPIPLGIAEAIGPYAESRSAGVVSWHPSERHMLISTRFADADQLHEVKFAGGARTQLTFFREPIRAAEYPPVGDGSYFLFSKDRGGDEFAQNWRFDRATGELMLLTDGASKNTLGPWSNRGDRMAYTSTRRTKKDTDVYVVNPRDPGSDRLVAEVDGGGWWPLDWSPADDKLLVENYVSVNESYLWLFDAAGGERVLLTEKSGDEPVSWAGGVFAPDGKSVIAISDVGGEFRDLVRLDVEKKQATPFVPSFGWDVMSYSISRDRKSLAAVINEGGKSRLKLFDAASGRERPVKPMIPDGVIRGLSWHNNGRDLAFSVSSARSPSDVYVLDTKAGKLERWTESEVGGLDADTFVEPEIIKWKSFDEKEIPGLYYKAPAKFAGKRPVVVIVHGGPEGQSMVGFITRNNYLLDKLGVSLIYPNVRGSTGYGKSYVRLDNGERREDSVKDLGALLEWIKEQPELDAERIMVMGGSYGGYMTLAASVHYADKIRCAVDIVGISNFVTFLEHTEAYRRDLRRAEYGDERDPKMREFLQKISPLTQAEKIKKPLLVIQGRNDPRVPVSEAEQIVATLERQGTPVWYVEAIDEGHGFSKKKNLDYQMYATVQFMKNYLLDGMAVP